MKPERAVVFAGGSGTRMSLSGIKAPKPLAHVMPGVGLVNLVVEQLRTAGVEHVTFALHHVADIVREAIESADLGVELSFVVEPKPLGTAGALALIDDLGSEPVFVANCDVITDLPLKQLADAHVAHGNELTMAASRQAHRIDFGVIEPAGANAVRIGRLTEKPVEQRLLNMGIYVVEPSAIDVIAPGEHIGMDQVVTRLIESERHVGFVPFDGVWIDVADGHDLGYLTQLAAGRNGGTRVSIASTGEISPCSCS